jgi:hypothetical protein
MTEIKVWRIIEVVALGRRLRGSYTMEGEASVRVRTGRGERVSPMWDTEPESVARLLLIEMAREGKT